MNSRDFFLVEQVPHRFSSFSGDEHTILKNVLHFVLHCVAPTECSLFNGSLTSWKGNYTLHPEKMHSTVTSHEWACSSGTRATVMLVIVTTLGSRDRSFSTLGSCILCFVYWQTWLQLSGFRRPPISYHLIYRFARGSLRNLLHFPARIFVQVVHVLVPRFWFAQINQL